MWMWCLSGCGLRGCALRAEYLLWKVDCWDGGIILYSCYGCLLYEKSIFGFVVGFDGWGSC